MRRSPRQNPTIDFLKPFRCICCVLLTKAKRPLGSKLVPEADKGLFVGYTKVAQSYRIFIPELNRIVALADVNFAPDKENNNIKKLTPSSNLHQDIIAQV